MIPLAPIIAAIPSLIKLFDKDDRKEGVQELTGSVLSEASKMLGVPVKSKDELLTHLNKNPNEVMKLKQLEYDTEIKLIVLDVEAIKSVNTTMQVETKSEHWQSYSWRPFIGFSFGFYVCSLFMLPLFGVQPVTMSADMVMAIGAVLGVASWHRGAMQHKKANHGKL